MMVKACMTTAELTLPQTHQFDQRSPLRWIVSHVSRNWLMVVLAFVGALGNAALAALVPILTGVAFNAILLDPADLKKLLLIAIWIVVSQLVRGAL